MIKRLAILLFALLLPRAGFAACTTATLPTDYLTAAGISRANLSGMFNSVRDAHNDCKDSLNALLAVMSGYNGTLNLASTANLIFRVDSDANGSNKFAFLGGGLDSLLVVREDSTWKTWGAGTGTKLTLSDSLLAATARISGLTASRLMATNADKTLASVSDLTSWVAGTSNQITSTSDGDGSITLSIPNGFTLPSASPTFAGLTLSGNATVGGTLGVTGVTRLGSATPTYATKNLSVVGASFDGTSLQYENTDVNTIANGRAFNFGITDVSGTNGRFDLTQPGERTVLSVFSNGNVGIGSTTDGGSGFQVAGTSTLTGALTLSTLSSGRIPVVSTAGLITQDDLYWDAANNRLGIGSGANSPNGDLDIIKSSINGTSDLSVQNSASSGLSHARIYTQVHSGSTGDPYFLANVSGGVAWAFGADNSDSDAFVISEADNLGTNNRLHIASGGAVTIPGTLGVTGASTLAALSATTGTFSSNLTQSAGVTSISVTDNTTNAVDIQQGSDNYINVNTTNSSENVSIGNATTNPTVSLLGTGTKTIDGTINTDLTASRTVVTDGSGNLSVNTETGTGSHVKATSPTLVTPNLGVASATNITLGGGDAFVYGDTTFTITVSTGMTTTPSGTARATRIGNVVTMEIPFLEGISNNTQTVLSGVPTTWKPPTRIQYVPLVCTENNGVDYYSNGSFAMVQDAANGYINIGFAGSTSGWTNSGTKAVGCNMFSATNVITYNLQ